MPFGDFIHQIMQRWRPTLGIIDACIIKSSSFIPIGTERRTTSGEQIYSFADMLNILKAERKNISNFNNKIDKGKEISQPLNDLLQKTDTSTSGLGYCCFSVMNKFIP